MTNLPVTLSSLTNLKILNQDKTKKSVTFQGQDELKNLAILTFEKLPYKVPDLDLVNGQNQGQNDHRNFIKNILSKENLNENNSNIKTIHINDIWSTYQVELLLPEFNEIKLKLIYPVDEKYVSENLTKIEKKLVLEGASEIENSEARSRVSLHKELEMFTTIDGFAVYKSRQFSENSDIRNLSLVIDTKLDSIQELNQGHSQAFKNLQQNLNKFLQNDPHNLKNPKNNLFYFINKSLHEKLYILVKHIEVEEFCEGMEIENACSLIDVIENLEMCGDYYKKMELLYSVNV